jgi:uncharacterized protein
VLSKLLVVLVLLVAAPVCGAAAPSRSATVRPDVRVFDYDAKAPLDVRVLSAKRTNGVTFQSLTYASPKGGRVPALLLVPDGMGPFPGILFMHGAPGDHRKMIPEAEGTARRGAVALLIDAPFARPGRPDPMPLHFNDRDRADAVQLIVDLRRGIDILTARRDVDPKRLGYLGISFGGAMGGLLAGVEKRIAAYALVVGDGGVVSHFTGPDVRDSPLERMPPEQAKRWLAAMEPVQPIYFVGRAAPAQLLFQNGRQDNVVPPSHAKAYQDAGSQPKTIRWYDAGHTLNDQAVRDRDDWLAQRLEISGRK